MPTPAVKIASDNKPQKSSHEVLESPEFKALVKKRWTVSMVLLVTLFVTYYGFVLLIAGNRELMAQKIGEYVTLAIPVGVAVIFAAFALTWAYVAWANHTYDPEVDRLKKQLRR
ncbi:MAG TPA: DUF485 domain-containing protein [Anaeromyxobacteraceae bacterium]|nr:DUF485 domain-containing protein [Anaeromyxobacteraceae bacterium]